MRPLLGETNDVPSEEERHKGVSVRLWLGDTDNILLSEADRPEMVSI